MKTWGIAFQVLVTVALLGSNAGAVSTRECPAGLEVAFRQVDLAPIERIWELYAEQSSMTSRDLDDEEKQILVEVAAKINSLGEVRGEWKRTEAKNGKCSYKSDAFTGVQIYSRNGKDLLLMELELDAVRAGSSTKRVVLRVYASLLKMSPTEIQVGPVQGLAIGVPRSGYQSYSAGGPLVFIGKVRDFSARARGAADFVSFQTRSLTATDLVAAVVQIPEGDIEVWFNSREEWLRDGSLSDGHEDGYYEVLERVVDEAGLCNSMEDTYTPCREGRSLEQIKADLARAGVSLDPDFQAWAEQEVRDSYGR